MIWIDERSTMEPSVLAGSYFLSLPPHTEDNFWHLLVTISTLVGSLDQEMPEVVFCVRGKGQEVAIRTTRDEMIVRDLPLPTIFGLAERA